MMRWYGLLLLLTLVACAPTTPKQNLPSDCLAEATAAELLSNNWLQQPGIWRLRQSALLELGPKKIPMEGFLRLDLQQNEARLLAMNEMGLVLFDLQITATDQQLKRAIPQLQQVKGFAQGVAQSLRQIFLQPRPQISDQLENNGNSQRLRRTLPGGNLSFVFDCLGNLRETRQQAKSGDWRVAYDQYQNYGPTQLPEQIILNDYQHSLKLSLWIREGKLEP